MTTFTRLGSLTSRNRPATRPYANNSTIISGSIASIGMPDSRKLASGAAAPAMAPAAGPAIRPTKMIGRCIGRNATPSMVPCPETAPMTWNSCGNATAATMASTVAAALMLRLSFGRSARRKARTDMVAESDIFILLFVFFSSMVVIRYPAMQCRQSCRQPIRFRSLRNNGFPTESTHRRIVAACADYVARADAVAQQA